MKRGEAWWYDALMIAALPLIIVLLIIAGVTGAINRLCWNILGRP